MCGITGIYHFDADHAVEVRLIESMNARIAHRGPNGHGIFLDRNMGLGHRRLSIIDLEGGAQPMTDPESGRTIVYNGEFFNYVEVRQELRRRGHSFRTNSDTEVLLKLSGDPIESWMPKVNGMFAFALWDPRDRALTLVRDRFGVKPLYYAVNSLALWFASEIKALVGIEQGPESRFESDALAEYLAFRHVLEPRTLFKDIKQLPAGHFMRVSGSSGRVQVCRYWDENSPTGGLPDTRGNAGDFAEAFSLAVRRRLVSDVPLGSFNSGGVDSSLVTREVRRQRSAELHTFSVGFAEADFDESRYAEEVAQTLGTTHHAEQLPPVDYARLLPAAIWHHDEPLCHPHSVHLMHLSGIAKRFVTVVLTGEGADELFCGYPRLHIPRIANSLGPVRGAAARALGGFSRFAGLRRLVKLSEVMGNGVAPEIDAHRFMPLDTLKQLCPGGDYLGSRYAAFRLIHRSQTSLERLLEYERASYLKSLLLRLDKMTMAHGLEARTPFLDFELVLWSKRLKAGDKLGLGWENKRVLKREAERHFSRDLVRRRKVGFGVPLATWFRGQSEFRDMLSGMSQAGSFLSGILPIERVRKLVDEHIAQTHSHTEAIWALLNLEVWAGTMLKNPGAKP